MLGMAALPPASAAAEGDTQAAVATHAGHGKVNSVNPEAGTINLTHEPIKSLKWPKMTMDFKAGDPALLKDIKPGAEVDFDLTKTEAGYRITRIAPTRQ
jgi:Cu/Ag efflux protein CusF